MKILWILFAVALVVAAVDTLFFQPESEEKPLVWSEEFSVAITRALVKQNVSGCGQYEWASLGGSKYRVRCTADGRNWVYHTVYAP